MSLPYEILARKRAGVALPTEEIQAAVQGAADGSWSDAQLGAFLMAVAIRGLEAEETAALTGAMLDSGERWELGAEVPGLCDKHSTGGLGDTVSLILAPLAAAAGLPMGMLAGRSLGHTGGTADKLESIPGLSLDQSRAEFTRSLRETGLAIGIATEEIAPADRRLYRLRDQTATVDSLPLITASIASKKLAMGASRIVFDIKCGNGAFLPEPEVAWTLARMLVGACEELGTEAAVLVTDMNQPLGEWSGNQVEVGAALQVLRGERQGPLLEVTFGLLEKLADLAGRPISGPEQRALLASGRPFELFLQWVDQRGGDAGALEHVGPRLAPVEVVVEAPVDGWVERVDTREIGLILVAAGAGGGPVFDPAVGFRLQARLGDQVRAGQPLGTLYLSRRDDTVGIRLRKCFEVSQEPVEPPALFLGPDYGMV